MAAPLAATPTIKLAVETSPSLAPRTAARSHPARPAVWRSEWGLTASRKDKGDSYFRALRNLLKG